MLTRRQLLRLGRAAAACAGGSALASVAGCSSRGADNQVIIYTTNEGNRTETLMTAISQDLPHLDVRMKYMSTGNLAARLKMEGEEAEFDIALGVEGGYLMAAQDALMPLSDRFSFDVFEDDLVISDKIMPFTRECGCFAYNTQVLDAAGIEPPQSLDDLLDPRFKGKIAMPNPKASSTGYNFYYSMVNLLGEEPALEYFDRLAENVYQFTSSGGAPATALTNGEAGVGLSLVFQLVSEKNDGSPIKLDFFPEGGTLDHERRLRRPRPRGPRGGLGGHGLALRQGHSAGQAEMGARQGLQEPGHHHRGLPHRHHLREHDGSI